MMSDKKSINESSANFSWRKDISFSPRKWVILVDDREWHRISTSIIPKQSDIQSLQKMALENGLEAAEQLFKELEYKGSLKWAIKQLSMRSMFEKDIEKVLKRHFVSQETIGLLLQYLRSKRYVNDKEKLSNMVESMRAKGKSSREIDQKIRRYRTDSEAEYSIDNDDDSGFQRSLAHDEESLFIFLKKQIDRLRGRQAITYQEKKKLIQKCARKGFSLDTINKVLSRFNIQLNRWEDEDS